MKKTTFVLLFFVLVFSFAACKKTVPQTPDVATATPQMTATSTAQTSATVTATTTATIAPTDVVVDDFEDSTLTQNLIDPPNNTWQFLNDSASSGTSTWAGSGHCLAPGYAGFGAQSMSITGTVQAHLATTGQFMGYLNVRTSVMTGGVGIDATKYANIVINALCDAVPPSGNMLYTFRLYNAIGQYITMNPSLNSGWTSFITPFYAFTSGGGWSAADVLSNLSVIEVRVQLFTLVQDDAVTFNLCLDRIALTGE